jgi:hypothetical protein
VIGTPGMSLLLTPDVQTAADAFDMKCRTVFESCQVHQICAVKHHPSVLACNEAAIQQQRLLA